MVETVGSVWDRSSFCSGQSCPMIRSVGGAVQYYLQGCKAHVSVMASVGRGDVAIATVCRGVKAVGHSS